MSVLNAEVVPLSQSRRSRLLSGLMLRSYLLSVMAIAATACGTGSLSAQTQALAPSQTAEAQTCARCHAAEVKDFAKNPHNQPSANHGMVCSECHGPGKAHIETNGATTDIFDPATAPAGQGNAKCLSCHQGRHASFESSIHGKSGLSCVGCHRIHQSGTGNALLKAAQPGLCYQCHAEVKSQFSQPFRHKIDRGPVECSDCHDPHGANEDRLPSATRQGAICTNCHTGVAGPFVFEHAAVKAEGCTACHVPHGGEQAHMLIRADIDGICQQCHRPVPDPATGAHVEPAGQQAAAHSWPCTGCHVNVHGSNLSPVFLREKGKAK